MAILAAAAALVLFILALGAFLLGVGDRLVMGLVLSGLVAHGVWLVEHTSPPSERG